MNVSNGLKAGSYVFNSNNLPPLFYTAKFTPEDPQAASNVYTWDFGDGTTQNNYNCVYTFNANKKYAVQFSTSAGSCGASITNPFNIGNPLQTNIKATRDMGQSQLLAYQFVAAPTGPGPYQYTWDFGDGSFFATDASPSHVYKKSGRYISKLLLTDAQNDTCVSYYQVSATSDKDCSANYITVFTPVNNTKALSAITVLVTDASGTVYSSKDYVQPAGSSFEIVSVEDYKANDLGQSTKKVKIKFSCTLNNNGSQLTVKNGEAVIAVAFK
jgi:PKD repeat protein